MESTPSSRPLTGIAFKVAAVLAFLAMWALIKAAQGVPPGQMVFIRSATGIVPVLVWMGLRGHFPEALKTSKFGSHLWRGIFSASAMAAGFSALTLLPLADATALSYATPLIVVVLAAVFLREPVHGYRWSAVALGLIGTLVVAWPNITLFSNDVSTAATLGVVVALLAAMLSAVAHMLIRRLVATERSGTVAFYMLAISAAASTASIPFGWVAPTAQQTLYLLGAGLAGAIGQILLAECYRYAQASVLAPFEYTSLVFAIVIGIVAFGDIPTWQMVVGGLLVVGAGLLIIFRERQLGKARPASEATATLE